jgi:mannose-6-phosphate isomerase-like protein (cupin superfamily)
MTHTYPRTIDNGAGERITFLRRVPGTVGERLEGENVVTPGAGPPLHVHYFQEEVFTVQEGMIGYQRTGEPARFAGPGETVVFKPGEVHRFWNAGEGDLRCIGHVEPADNVEYFLTALFESSSRHKGGRPGLFDIAFLASRYRDEFAMVEIPTAVQRFLFPAVVAVGTLLGRYRRYADAPAPVRRVTSARTTR